MGKFESIRADLDAIEDEADNAERKIAELKDAVADAHASAGDEIAEQFTFLARELEPVFAAIYRGDLDSAQRGLSALAGVLGGNDPILIALQRAKARPHLHVHVAA